MKSLFRIIFNKETFLYLTFGIIVTILNITLYHLFVNIIKITTALGNILDTVICMLIQYFTNRFYVFKSRNLGLAAFEEFIRFIIVRVSTAIIDEIIVVVGVELILKRIVKAAFKSALGIFVKIISSAIVILLNYIFSKNVVFGKKEYKKNI